MRTFEQLAAEVAKASRLTLSTHLRGDGSRYADLIVYTQIHCQSWPGTAIALGRTATRKESPR